MNINEILTCGGGALVAVMTLVQIAPVKINPWTGLAKLLGRAINADVLKELKETKDKLEEHIRMDDERNADLHRVRILRFNTELLREQKHTEEEFNEVLYDIDCYERYCEGTPEYRNNRAVHAIKNIKRVFDELMKTHDFL